MFRRYLLSLLLLACILPAAAQTTTSLGFNEPLVGSLSWGTNMNNNFTLLNGYLTGARTLPAMTVGTLNGLNSITFTDGSVLHTAQLAAPIDCSSVGAGYVLQKISATWVPTCILPSGGGGSIGGTIAANQLVGGTGANTVGPIADGTGEWQWGQNSNLSLDCEHDPSCSINLTDNVGNQTLMYPGQLYLTPPTSSGVQLDFNGYVQAFTTVGESMFYGNELYQDAVPFSEVPTCGAAGCLINITDSPTQTIGDIVSSGGGTYTVQIFWNGTAWVVGAGGVGGGAGSGCTPAGAQFDVLSADGSGGCVGDANFTYNPSSGAVVINGGNGPGAGLFLDYGSNIVMPFGDVSANAFCLGGGTDDCIGLGGTFTFPQSVIVEDTFEVQDSATIDGTTTMEGPAVFQAGITTPITGVSDNCLHVDSSGVMSGTGAPCGSGGGSGVSSINSTTGAFTFSGAGVSCSGTTCSFSGGTGSGTVGSGTTGQFGYYSASGTAIAGRTLIAGDIPALPYLPNSTVLPANTTATAHNFFTAYNSSTGAFTQAQPAFTDISGTPSTTQVPVQSLTTTGGGAATLSAGVLNIPTPGGGGTTTNPLTMDDSGTGATSGATFDGSAAKTISYNTIGAASAPLPHTILTTCTNPTVAANASTLMIYQITSDCALTLPAGPTTNISIQNASTHTLTVAPPSGTISLPDATTTAVQTVAHNQAITYLWVAGSSTYAASSLTATGTGAPVLATSPALTTPNLGTPSAINLTNATGAPTWNQNTTGTAGGLSANIIESQVTNLTSDLATKPTAALSTDGTMAADSDANVPSQKAVVTYVGAHAGCTGDFCGKTVGAGIAASGSTITTVGSTTTWWPLYDTSTSYTANQPLFFPVGTNASAVPMAITVPTNGANSQATSTCQLGVLPTATWVVTFYHITGTTAGCTGTKTSMGTDTIATSGAQTWSLTQTSFAANDCFAANAQSSVDTTAAYLQCSLAVVK